MIFLFNHLEIKEHGLWKTCDYLFVFDTANRISFVYTFEVIHLFYVAEDIFKVWN
jgi:hypothetical protein